MMSSAATSSPVSASTLAYLMRWPVLRLIWLKLTFSESEVAGYSATGQVTSERRRKPFQLARGAMAYSNAADDLTIPLRNPDSRAGGTIRSGRPPPSNGLVYGDWPIARGIRQASRRPV